MKLYTGDLSPYSAKIRMQIYAMGIRDDFEFDLPLAQFFSGRFSDLSPIGRIPVLELDDGTIIPESEVIAEYIDDVYPDRAMVGSTSVERANVRVISRIADTYLMNNIFMALPQVNRETRVDAVVELLIGQVRRGMGALEKHIGEGYAASGSLTRADCTLVPALFRCERTVPRLDVPNPIDGHEKVAAYWGRIQQNEHAARVVDEMARGLQARLDGTEKKMVQAAMASSGP